MIDDTYIMYTKCKWCDHFVDEDDLIHMDDGDKDHDHVAELSDMTYNFYEWQYNRPDLFVLHPDGKIGPNSKRHVQAGKAKLKNSFHQ
jgi:hypothetical protein